MEEGDFWIKKLENNEMQMILIFLKLTQKKTAFMGHISNAKTEFANICFSDLTPVL